MSRWKTSNTAVYNVAYHSIFCPKYRRKVLLGKVETRLRELLYQKAQRLGVEIETLEIMPDHLRMFVKAQPNRPPQQIVGQFKGYTSRVLRNEFASLRSRLPTLRRPLVLPRNDRPHFRRDDPPLHRGSEERLTVAPYPQIPPVRLEAG